MRARFATPVIPIDEGAKGLARHYVKPADRVGDKLSENFEWGKETRAPVLSDAYAFLECRVQSITEPGDHALIIGEIVNADRRRESQPLTCSDMGWTYGG